MRDNYYSQGERKDIRIKPSVRKYGNRTESKNTGFFKAHKEHSVQTKEKFEIILANQNKTPNLRPN